MGQEIIEKGTDRIPQQDMNVNQVPHRTIWIKPGNPRTIQVIDQRFLPHQFVIEDLTNLEETIRAIKDMHVRGAPLIGVTAAYGVYLALLHAPKTNFESYFKEAMERLQNARPTAVNLAWAVSEQLRATQSAQSIEEKTKIAFARAGEIADQDVETCRRIGEYGLALIEQIYRKKKSTVNILTHCNAGWLACVDWGTQTAPIYQAFAKQIPVHVWVSETRPRNQGANLTAWELSEENVPHTVIADNTAGHLIQRGMVDLVLVGTDRTTAFGDVANKIGTYLKALAAKEHGVPFYVALPASSIDWEIEDALREIPIEERNSDEVKFVEGLSDGVIKKVLITPKNSAAKNYAFDVTPAKFVTGLITERGIAAANRESILNLFPEKSGRDEGVIKFHCHWTAKELPSSRALQELNQFRNQFYDLGLIGEYEDKIGFGNISVRSNQNQFLISGTQTGGLRRLSERHYTKVTGFDLSKNSVICEGPVQASSESLTHAVLYELSDQINAVIHIHEPASWERLQGELPTTTKEIPYGTPEMALEVKRLFRETGLSEAKVFVMAGHEDGIVAFGKDLKEANERLLSVLNLPSRTH